MVDVVGMLQDGHPQLGCRWQEDPTIMDNNVVHDRAAFVHRVGRDFLSLGDDLLQRRSLPAKFIKQFKIGNR
jgi:hypothetical protein